MCEQDWGNLGTIGTWAWTQIHLADEMSSLEGWGRGGGREKVWS